jgi:hypothetical protein
LSKIQRINQLRQHKDKTARSIGQARKKGSAMAGLLRFLLAVLVVGSVPDVALAQAKSWTLSEVSGRVTLERGQGAEAAARGDTVRPGAVLETGPKSRAVLVRGKDFVTVAPSSRIRIPAPQAREAGLFDVLQDWGNAIFQVEKQPNPHFGVGTPYLAAVVKGTTFSITVSQEGASLQVTEGAVETSTSDGGARDLIRPGIVAMVAASDRYRLTVQGQDTRTIDSPLRSNGGATEAPSVDVVEPAAPVASMEPETGAIGQPTVSAPASPPVELTQMSVASTIGAQLIGQLVASAPVDLGQLTGGLVSGTAAVQGASASITRDVSRPAEGGSIGSPGAPDGPQPGRPSNTPGNGSGPGNGTGGGTPIDPPGTGVGGAAPGPGAGGSGNGNPNPGNGVEPRQWQRPGQQPRQWQRQRPRSGPRQRKRGRQR